MMLPCRRLYRGRVTDRRRRGREPGMREESIVNRAEQAHTVRAFPDRASAERAIEDLRAGGWPDDDIGYIVHDAEAEALEERAERTAEGAVTGAAAGGLIGGLGAVAVSLLIPGVGPIIGGGLLATLLGGAAMGAGAGGILGAIGGLGVPEEEARFYEEEFRAGRPLVSVRGDRVEEAAAILHRHGGYDGTRPPARRE
jgi:hypothetical protein